MRTHDLLDKRKGKRKMSGTSSGLKAINRDQSISEEETTEEELTEADSSRPNKSMCISKKSIQYANKHIVRRLTSSFAGMSFQYDAPFTQVLKEAIAQPVPFSGKLLFFTCNYSYYCDRSLPGDVSDYAACLRFAGYHYGGYNEPATEKIDLSQA
jgi:hypothetical protein